MDRLAYIMRGNKSPQGIPRVYFCCHPQDTDLYLPTIAEQILEISDCAIWYDTTPEVPTDAVFYAFLRGNLLRTEQPCRLSIAKQNLLSISVLSVLAVLRNG